MQKLGYVPSVPEFIIPEFILMELIFPELVLSAVAP